MFYLYGVQDVGAADRYLAPVRAAGVDGRTLPPLRYRRFVQSLAEVAIGLHPVCRSNPFSRGKSFGKLLAYMAVITSDAVDHPLFFRHAESGVLLNDDPGQWANWCSELLADPAARSRMVDRARLLTPVDRKDVTGTGRGGIPPRNQ